MSHFPYADFFPVPEKKEVLCTLSGHEKQEELVPLQLGDMASQRLWMGIYLIFLIHNFSAPISVKKEFPGCQCCLQGSVYVCILVMLHLLHAT